MSSDDALPPRLTLLQRREIEARIVGPLIRAFASEIGEAETLEVVRGVVARLAREGGADLAAAIGAHTLDAFAGSLDRWKEGGALEIDVLEQSPERLSFNVRRCRYAELYQALGLADLGSSLSCQRDYALAEGFNPAIRLTRTQTIMEGAAFCDFRFRLETTENSPPCDSSPTDPAPAPPPARVSSASPADNSDAPPEPTI